ncbi:autotransporter assembly complex protein TamA [Asaia sp. HN010]|uniref:autotransporter assembly complex protein TamA n=1 Tax=Asaia sp. HN010 TaxID=3081233 RepID=UPI0038D1A55C
MAEHDEAYQVDILPSSDPDLDPMVQASSTLVSLQKTRAVDPYALAGRIRGDYDRVQTALESRGFYSGKVIITVRLPDGREIDGRDPALPDRLAATNDAASTGKKLRFTIKTITGPQFHIGTITLVAGPLNGESPPSAPVKPVPQDGVGGKAVPGAKNDHGVPPVKAAPQPAALDEVARKAFGLETGQKAVASDVLAAQSGLLHALLEEGHAQANVSTPVAYLRPATHTLDLEFAVGVGPVVDIGPVSFTGLERTREKFLRRRLLIHEGQLYQPSKIEEARQDLAGVGIFSSVGVHDAPPLVALARGQGTPGVTQAMPLRFALAEGKRHTVSGQVGYSTDLGGRLGASWTHRNLLGAAEQLKLTALVTGLGGSAQQGLGYDVYADFLKPDFLRRDQNLSLRVEGIRQLLYSYHQTAILLRGGLIRRLNKRWSVNGSLVAEQENIKQFGVSTNYLIVQLPLGAVYDSTELSNPIDPATHGMRATVNITPSESLENGSAFFTIMSASASTYFDLHRIGVSAPGRSVIAVRGLVGSVQGASTYQIPPDQRLYAGGPATVRGFRYQGVGPQNGKYGIGGTSLDAGSVEFRQRILKSFGAAAFVDAGQVGVGSRPFQGKLRVGYGAGVRYYTPIGPVRLDVVLPANRPPHGDKWELYIGLGETF